MHIIALGLASILTAIWLVLLFGATKNEWLLAAYNKVLDDRLAVEKLERKDALKEAELQQYTGVMRKIKQFFAGKGSEKEIRRLQKEAAGIQKGNLKKVGVLDIPGYVAQRRFERIAKGELHKKLLICCTELYGKKFAVNKTKQLIARIISYPIIGVAFVLVIGAVAYCIGSHITAFLIMGVGTLLIGVLTYALYDDVSDQLKKRRAAISRQFPNVVSKLALLVTSGMIMDRAWKETAESQNLELYMEMRKTSDELGNLMDPTTAYTNFINRCNTKETTKLASAIIQNLSKGNAEIGILLKSMAHEAWEERRHMAKRDSENANSKLMIPTMLLFASILIMIVVPLISKFTSL